MTQLPHLPHCQPHATNHRAKDSSHFKWQALDIFCASTYISISAVPRLAANTQFVQSPSKPTGEIKFSSVPLASRKAVRTTLSSTEHIKILEGMGF
ncbi:hypothetical protein CEK26_002597 [Fusarium fujikuroi]|uniref:Uncharacterized protein n=1 Tax=Fusarium fujikuroi TaxID=5127 RepID=A0A5Q3F8N2_FUSFU|nr:hypothetical protein CEK27_002593 [Fusarium fujikuroi]QGI87621.1 hypothetical protein CEK25_002577 [Fusarium fujikuroi]QGJ01153.1 hypothetical protein CEK26_002597 [Fusarium fujikuroi]VTT57914.1 unnamed protein product [Fusarium fujikuroi]VTT71279.1 unnamed protein product [Fusarium fujikuroi]